MEPESPFHSIRERLATIDKSLCVSPLRFPSGDDGGRDVGIGAGGVAGRSRNRSRRAVAPMPLNHLSGNAGNAGVGSSTMNISSSNNYQTPIKKKKNKYPYPNSHSHSHSSSTPDAGASKNGVNYKTASQSTEKKKLFKSNSSSGGSNSVTKSRRRPKNNHNPLPPPPSSSTTNQKENVIGNSNQSSDENIPSMMNTAARAAPLRGSSASHVPQRTPSQGRNRNRKTTTTQTQVDFQSVLRIRPFHQEELEQGESEHIFTTLPEYDDHDDSPVMDDKWKMRRTSDEGDGGGGNTRTVRMHNPNDHSSSHMDFHFDSVLGPDCEQGETYEMIGGQTMALDALNPILLGSTCSGGGGSSGMVGMDFLDIEAKHHVIISMGVSNSGKTFTIFGPCSDVNGDVNGNGNPDSAVKKEDEGIVPRLMDDLFLSGEDIDPSLRNMLHHHGTDGDAPQLELELSMIHLHNDRVFDMLTPYSSKSVDETKKKKKKGKRTSNVSKMIESFEISSSSRSSSSSWGYDPTSSMCMEELKIFQDGRTQDFVVEPTIVQCPTSADAREVLHTGLMQNTVKSTKLNKTSSRGHTIVTLRPVLKMASLECEGSYVLDGGSITIMDLAGIENTKQSAVLGPSMRESVSINTSISALMQCLRSIKTNQERTHDLLKDEKNQTPNINKEKSRGKKGTIAGGKKNKGSAQLMIVPYRENKLTKLMQPLFSGTSSARTSQGASNISKVRTVVQMFISVYPGMKDFSEKKSLLQDIDSLRGLSVERTLQRTVPEDQILPYIKPASSVDSTETVSTRKESMSPTESQSVNFSSCLNPENIASSLCHDACVNGINKDEITTTPRTDKRKKTMKSPLQLLTSVVKPNSGRKRKAEMDALNDRIKMLEDENAALKKTNNDVIRKCQSLSNDNKRLKLLLAESEQREKNAVQKITMTAAFGRDFKKEEEEFQFGRKLRRSAQNLIPSPIIEHMKTVERTKSFHSGKVGHYLQEKSPFPFEGPAQRRLREEREVEEAELLSDPKDEQQQCDIKDELDIVRSASMESASA